MERTMVIAVAAISGGGKTTVINELLKKLPLSKAIYFDDYDFEECPQDFYKWVQEGADYNEWNTEILAKDIDILLGDRKLKHILLDYPFAYKNNKIAPYIDFTIFIDTPLDIAMARRILRDIIDEPKDRLKQDLSYYISHGRTAYLEMIKTIKPNSDLIIDGNLSVDEITNGIIEELSNKDIRLKN